MNEHRDVLCSTSTEHGGSGRPQPFVLGKGRRMLRGMELGLPGGLDGRTQRLAACLTALPWPALSCLGGPTMGAAALNARSSTAPAAQAQVPECPVQAAGRCRRDDGGGARHAGHQARVRLPAQTQRDAAAGGCAARGARCGRRHGVWGGVGWGWGWGWGEGRRPLPAAWLVTGQVYNALPARPPQLGQRPPRPTSSSNWFELLSRLPRPCS